MPSERTPLTGSGDPGPPYVFVTNPNRMYRKQIREFQCCVCATILLIFLAALVASITYSVDNDVIDNPNNTVPVTPVVAPNLTLQTLLGLSWPLKDEGAGNWQGPNLNSEQIQQAVLQSHEAIAKLNSEKSDGPLLPVDSPSYRHQQSIRTSMKAVQLASLGFLGETATKFVNKNSSVKGSIGKGPAFTSCDDESDTIICNSFPYRTYEGICNNLKHKTWGAAMNSFKREISPDYADGISKPRASSDGSDLPSAREVSLTVHRPVYRDDPKFTVMLAVWGQFMDHDLTATALTKGKDGGTITCCGVSKDIQNPACYPVELKSGDSYYHKYNMTCMEFVRSSPAPSCTLGPREQLNQVSSYLDGSVVYGNTEELAKKLRTFNKGELKMFVTPDNRELLPISTDPEDGCNEKEQNSKGRYCFMTGDFRANENTHLTSMHLILARQHNTLARQLSTLNPDWDDETIYQESRRILSAQMQHITYNEFLPVILGPALMTKLSLNVQSSGYWKNYNSEVDPTISNNFATSAFRFAHTLIPGLMKILANDTSSIEYVELHKMLFNPYEIYAEGGLDKTLKGAMSTNVERADNYFTTQLTQHLFEQVGSKIPYGLDLVSLNIQRGRDHGLPGYPSWRKYCGLSEPKTFDDLNEDIDAESLKLLKTIYKSVEDVDMYTGGLSEKPIEGGMLGPTMTCLIANQFVRLKFGDRYWYETNEKPQSFSEQQLNEIRKTTLAGIICQNSDHVNYTQKKVMELVNKDNPRVSCVEIPQPDLTHWMLNEKDNLKMFSPNNSSVVTKLGSKVVSGSIISNGKQLWNGVLPVEIPLETLGVTDSKNRHYVQWTGSLLSSSLNSAELKGTFMIPSPSVNGSFKFDLSLFWNSTNSPKFNSNGSYNTQIIFAQRDTLSALLSAELLSSSSETSKVILYGQYIKNNTAFIWNGNSTIILVNKPTDSEIPIENKNLQSISPQNLIYENPAFGVTNGNLQLNSTMVWSGVTPVTIPVKQLLGPNKTEVFAYFTKFRGIITDNKFVGNFTVSEYNAGVKTLTNGQFVLLLIPLNNQPLGLQPLVDYNAKIIFRQSDGRSVVDWAKEGHEKEIGNIEISSNSLNGLLESSEDAANSVTIVLQGAFSDDKSSFSWSGNFVFFTHTSKVPALDLAVSSQFKSDDPEKDKAKADDKANKGLVYGVHVQHATVTGGFDGAPAKNLIDGPFPEMMYIGDVFTGIAAWERSIPVVWKGKLENGIITGNYSTQIKGQVLEGTFTANIIPTFKPFPADMINSNTEYSSSVSFKQYNSLSASANSLSLPLKATTTSFQLIGTFSPDTTSFYFPGDLTFTVGATPKVETQISQLKLDSSLKTSKEKDASSDDSKKKGKSKKKDKDGKKKPAKGETVGVMVKNAVITSGLNGTNPTEVFSGKLPLMSYVGDMFKGMPPWQRGINVLWIAKIVGNTIRGNYSTVVQGQLYSGSFSADLAPMWKPTLDLNILKSDTYYSTNLLFTQWGKSSGISPVDPTPTKSQDDGSLLKLFSSAQQLTLGAIDSSVIIVGTFSPDSTSFYWPGSLRFIKTPPVVPVPDDIPTSTSQPSVSTPSKPDVSSKAPATSSAQPSISTGSKPDVSFEAPASTTSDINLSLGSKSKTDKVSDDVIPDWYRGKLAVKVLGGYVSASLENRPTESWWYEFLPVDLPSNPFWTPTSDVAPADNNTVFSHGIIWSATDIGEYNIQGTFSMPQYVRSNGELYSVQWYNGEFNFRFSPLWNSLMNQFVELNVKYYSPLHFQSTSNPWLESAPSQDVINSARPAPIILLGNQTAEKFSWFGSAIVAFR